MTGCPNGCARPYTADLAFVGRSLDLYQVYVGGRGRGDRMADLFAADVPTADLVTTVRPLLEWWAAESHEKVARLLHEAAPAAAALRDRRGRTPAERVPVAAWGWLAEAPA